LILKNASRLVKNKLVNGEGVKRANSLEFAR